MDAREKAELEAFDMDAPMYTHVWGMMTMHLRYADSTGAKVAGVAFFLLSGLAMPIILVLMGGGLVLGKAGMLIDDFRNRKLTPAERTRQIMGRIKPVNIPMDRDYYDSKEILDRKAAARAAAKAAASASSPSE